MMSVQVLWDDMWENTINIHLILVKFWENIIPFAANAGSMLYNEFVLED